MTLAGRVIAHHILWHQARCPIIIVKRIMSFPAQNNHFFNFILPPPSQRSMGDVYPIKEPSKHQQKRWRVPYSFNIVSSSPCSEPLKIRPKSRCMKTYWCCRKNTMIEMMKDPHNFNSALLPCLKTECELWENGGSLF